MNETTNTPLTCSPNQAARRIGIGRDRVYWLCRTGQLPAYKVGRSYRIPIAVLDSWLAEQAERESAERLAEFQAEQQGPGSSWSNPS